MNDDGRTTGDLLLRGGLIVDGSGAAPATGDVLVRAGRIAGVGGRIDADGVRVIDADGLAVAPGFIDMHAHSDLAVLADGAHLAKVTQGVTTEVVGQDGISYAPVTDSTMATVREQIAGWNGTPDGVDFAWRSVAEYLAEIDRRGSATNVAYLLPQGAIRMNVVGTGDERASAADLAEMRAQVDQGMREGAFGLSSGLTYVPGMFASTDELVALCEVVARHGGYYSPHQRSYGAGALAAYAEMVEVAERARCALHLTHATMNFPENRGRAGELLALVDRAIDAGVDVTLDTYPYLPGSTTLSALLPSRAAVGGPEATLARLRDADQRAWIAHEVEVIGSDGCHGVPVDWDTIEIAGVRDAALGDRVGRTVARIALDEARPPAEVFFDLLLADRLGTSILQHVGDEGNVREIMRHRRHTGGSDGILIGAKPHPRGSGTFPRYLGRYVREEGVLSLADMIVHLAARPAARLGLHDRGRVAEGLVADLVVFDPATVIDRATPDDPRRTADGIPWVLVGGTPVIEDGARTDVRPGRALRHGARAAVVPTTA
ncbi:amidohydrolase family protein [Promicromonospora sp. Populi]|uniref:N-acyl-D-amino-acid deacylase family protein n=1 Tax=Promicromonospora sp. Populi TaxID=3239420 RepID=UPI0034E1F54C